MNINSTFDNINNIKTFLSNLNEADWKSKKITPNKIEAFLDRNLTLIANHKDVSLHEQLNHLSNRINIEWDNPQTHNLAFVIMGIAKGALEFRGSLPAVPPDVWIAILSRVPPRHKTIRYKPGGLPSGLENFYPSKETNNAAQKVEIQWASEQLVSLKKYGAKTAQDAVTYAIDNKLTGVNLSEFPDLEESDLEKLFKDSPQIEKLYVQSGKIKTLPEGATALTALYCDKCENLQSLPDLPQLQELYIRWCANLQHLPKLSQVQVLKIRWCKNLVSLPELPRVQELYINSCENLDNLPGLPRVKVLKCKKCPKLPAVPIENFNFN